MHVSALRTGRSRGHARRDTLIASAAAAGWLALTVALAASGRLSFTSVPPTEGMVIVASLALGVGIGVSRLGFRIATGIPLAALVGVQAFRFPLELMLHRAYVEGLMPVQMSYSGFNFDILSGLSANEWIAHAPWVWLPSVYVVAAIIGHLVVFRRLRYESRVATRREASAAVESRAVVS